MTLGVAPLQDILNRCLLLRCDHNEMLRSYLEGFSIVARTRKEVPMSSLAPSAKKQEPMTFVCSSVHLEEAYSCQIRFHLAAQAV